MNALPAGTKHVLLLDLYYGGHHAQYIEQLLQFKPSWCDLSIAVTDPLFQESDVLSSLRSDGSDGPKLIRVCGARLSAGGVAGLLRNDLEHGRQLRRLIRKVRPDHCLLMYFDHVQLSLGLNLRFDFPVELSGIYFRPSFHYGSFPGARASMAETLMNVRKRSTLRTALRNPHLTHLFCLDPFAAEHIRGWDTGRHVVALPDGADIGESASSRSDPNEDWGVESGRRIALMFGMIDKRKGVTKVLRSLEHLNGSAQRRLCLALIGPQDEEERADISASLERARKATRVQIVVRDRVIKQDEIQNVVSAAALIVLTYQHHVGSSNVLVRAAAAGIPVIGPRYGLVGEYLRRHRLGVAIDPTEPASIARALEAFLDGSGIASFDADDARQFASRHTSEGFATTIFDSIL